MSDDEQTPLVTVYVTNYNYGKYLQKSIESVLNQALQDFELLVIDDGSTDNSREIIAQFENNPRVTAIFQQNKGLNVTNNIALRSARGRYIMRLDADDYLDPHALMVMSDAMEQDPEVGMVFPDYFNIDPSGNIIELVRRHDFDEVTVMDQPAHGACTMIRRKELIDLGGYDESFRCQDGWDIWVRFIHKHKVKNVNLPLFYYRQHEESLTKNEEMILSTRAAIFNKQSKLRDKEPNVLAVIAVRGQTSNKQSIALRPLGDKALIDWSIDSALNARTVTTVVVSSPDQQIMKSVADRYESGVVRHHRSAELAQPNSNIEDTLLKALEFAEKSEGKSYDLLLHLGIRCPFRSQQSVDTIVEVMRTFETDTVVGVRGEMNIFYQHNGQGLVPLRQSTALRLEREELYRDPGSIRLIDVSHLKRTRKAIGERVGHLALDQRSAFDLHSELDWKLAEALIASECTETKKHNSET